MISGGCELSSMVLALIPTLEFCTRGPGYEHVGKGVGPFVRAMTGPGGIVKPICSCARPTILCKVCAQRA